MSYRDEFPDYPVADMPPIPAGFVDTSWHNDVCPSFSEREDGSGGLCIWVDYADASTREFPETPRFSLTRYAGDCGEDAEIAASDDFADILTAIEKERAQ